MDKLRFIQPPLFEKYKIKGFFSTAIAPNIAPTLLLRAMYPGYEVFLPSQIHSADVLYLDALPFKQSFQGDGIITRLSKVIVGVKTADCVPILIATKDNSLVGAIHAGWRGSIKQILYKAILKILTLGYTPTDILIAIGPHIRPCCYEVGNEVLNLLKQNFPNFMDFILGLNDRIHLNLTKLNLFQASACKVPEENIWVSNDCTFCQHDIYYSYRYHGKTRGYQLSFIFKELE
jgi:YfiH family protein